MSIFTQPLEEYGEIVRAKECVSRGKTPVLITGCIDSQKCNMAACIGEAYDVRLIVTYNDIRAKEIYDDFRLYDRDVFLYPAKDIIFYNADIHGNAIVKERLKVLKRIIEREPVTIVTTLTAGMDKILPLDTIKKRVIRISKEDSLDIAKLEKKLVNIGYQRQIQAEAPGEFAVRGGIIDVYPITEEVPVRIELWGDEIESIRAYEVTTQRSIEELDEIVIFPASEITVDTELIESGIKNIEKEKKSVVKVLRDDARNEEAHRLEQQLAEFEENLRCFQGFVSLDSYINYFYENTVSFFDYFGSETCIFLDEPVRMLEGTDAVTKEFADSMTGRIEKGYILPGQMNVIYEGKELLAGLSLKNTVILSMMEHKTGIQVKESFDISVKSVNPYNNNFELLLKDLEAFKKKGYRVILLSGSEARAERLSEDLRQHDIMAVYVKDTDRKLLEKEIVIMHGNIHKGFEYPLLKFVIISESDIFGKIKKHKKKKSNYEGRAIQSFSELTPGDYIIHENHGIGIYRGIEKITVDKIEKDYIKLEYGGGGVLYILATGLDVIQKYADADAKKPKLNKLNSVEWKNTKTRVRGAVRNMAKELIELYAKRQERQGHAFEPDTVWQREFEDAFPYDETDDQLRAIEDTKRDMESNKIMDRLICGDVGFGKTEVAIRAAAKAAFCNRQVVFLVPTTILAQQHYNTFLQRFEGTGVTVDMLSRFRTPAQQKAALARLKKGELDIIIGTHRVLSKDVQFKNLGLLIIDEEQRFGVGHKEKIKQLKENIDVLTLTATPIPRTLHMGLAGIRSMSVLEEPPVDRLPIQTFVMEHNDEMIREAINRELARGGQVYYVYNRVNGIDDIAANVARLVPDANVAYAHGQMSERQLEKIMFDFINGEIDVLVSTTIIETGLDISNVNTMIIDDADKLGLSQLYQLRGRVGRSNRTSYAFLMYKRDKMLKEIAEKRLQAIKEFTELGSGFKISMRDLEIRGAGNLLGAEQSGHMESVGYDLYCKMLNEAIKQMKGEKVIEEDFETVVDIDTDAFIPATYIKNEVQKLEMYKRIAGIESREEFMDVSDELLDRFGEPPKPVMNLLNIALIKNKAHRVFVTSIRQKQGIVRLNLYNRAGLDGSAIPALIEKYDNSLQFTAGELPCFTYVIPVSRVNGKLIKASPAQAFEYLNSLLDDMEAFLVPVNKL